MDKVAEITNQENVAGAFGKQAPLFDVLYGPDPCIQYKRTRVRTHVLKYLRPGSDILELNAGTGEDAIYFARQKHRVHATDIAEGMLAVAKEKISAGHAEDLVSCEQCSYTALAGLKYKGPFDLIFSNFAGLNCTGELDKVLAGFSDLLKPGGLVTLVVLPRFCLWELLLLLKGKFRTAFRRFRTRTGTNAKVEDESFACWYYNPSYITDRLKDEFELLEIEGLCTIVPPSYIAGFAEKYPGLFRFLCKTEEKYKCSWPWKYIGDYYIISLRKK